MPVLVYPQAHAMVCSLSFYVPDILLYKRSYIAPEDCAGLLPQQGHRLHSFRVPDLPSHATDFIYYAIYRRT
jgi:hypothetical protein